MRILFCWMVASCFWVILEFAPNAWTPKSTTNSTVSVKKPKEDQSECDLKPKNVLSKVHRFFWQNDAWLTPISILQAVKADFTSIALGKQTKCPTINHLVASYRKQGEFPMCR